MAPMMMPMLEGSMAGMIGLVNQEAAARATLSSEDEPPLPVSAGRFSSEPLAASSADG